MSGIVRFTDACVRSAARRWPPPLADTMAETWRAELAYLRNDRQINAYTRLYRQVAFAVSLALSPAQSEHTVPLTWRDRLPGVGRGVRTVLLYCLVPLLATTLAQSFDAPATWVALALDYLLSLVVMVWIAVLVVRARSQAPGRGPIMRAAAAALPLGVVTYLLVIPAYNTRHFGAQHQGALAAISVLSWTVLMIGVLAIAERCAAAGRRALAWAVGVIGAFVAVDVQGAIQTWRIATRVGFGLVQAPLWSPLSLISPVGRPSFGSLFDVNALYPDSAPADYVPASHLVVTTDLALVLPLLLCAVFAVTVTVRAAEQSAVAAEIPVGQPATKLEPVARGSDGGLPARLPLPVRAVAVALAIAGTGLWGYLFGLHKSPHVEAGSGFIFGFATNVSTHFTVAGLIACAFAMLLIGRGPVAVPAIGAFALMVIADVVVAREHGHDQRAGAAMIVVAALAYAGARWLSRFMARTIRSILPTEGRRTLVFIAIAATMATPAGLRPSHGASTNVVLATYALAGLLWIVAITAALAARPAPLSRVASVAVILGGLVIVLVSVPYAVVHALYWFGQDLVLQLPLMLLVLLVATPPRPAERPRSYARWGLLAIVLLVASPLISRDLGVLDLALDWPLKLATGAHSGPPNSGDGGAVLLGITLAALLSRRDTSPPPVSPGPPTSDVNGPVGAVA